MNPSNLNNCLFVLNLGYLKCFVSAHQLVYRQNELPLINVGSIEPSGCTVISLLLVEREEKKGSTHWNENKNNSTVLQWQVRIGVDTWLGTLHSTVSFLKERQSANKWSSESVSPYQVNNNNKENGRTCSRYGRIIGNLDEGTNSEMFAT